MKIAISSIDGDPEGNVAEAFGRCPFFVIAEIGDGKTIGIAAIRHEDSGQAGGAGISAAKLVTENGAEAVIAGSVGPRALDVLNQFGIEAYSASGPTQDALRDLEEGKLDKIK